MAKYQYITCSNGRIALYDEEDFENAVSLEKSLLIICGGEAYVVGADRIDDDNYSCYTIKVNNITYAAEELQKFYKVIITEGIRVYMKTGEPATYHSEYAFCDDYTTYDDFVNSVWYNGESETKFEELCQTVDVKATKRYLSGNREKAKEIWDSIKGLSWFYEEKEEK